MFFKIFTAIRVTFYDKEWSINLSMFDMISWFKSVNLMSFLRTLNIKWWFSTLVMVWSSIMENC